MKFYYKIVRQIPNLPDYYSLIVKGKARVTYKVGEWITPPDWLMDKNYGLCVFEDLEVAKLFFKEQTFIGQSTIFKVVCKGRLRTMPGYRELMLLSVGVFSQNVYQFPYGTVMFQSVKLIEPVT